MLLSPEALAERIGRSAAVVVGSAARAIASAVAVAGGEAMALLPDLQPDARDLAAMAGDLSPVSGLRPLYMRPPDARPQDGKSLPLAQP
jgi:hypothetical protein